MPTLKGKLALVSGGARDIGQAVALDLARHGADVVFTHATTPPDATLAARKKLGLVGSVRCAGVGDSRNSNSPPAPKNSTPSTTPPPWPW